MSVRIKVLDTDKQKVLKRFAIARGSLNSIIESGEFEKSWLTIHKALNGARKQLNMATYIIARRHLHTCLLKRSPEIIEHSSSEIIKTFNYLG